MNGKLHEMNGVSVLKPVNAVIQDDGFAFEITDAGCRSLREVATPESRSPVPELSFRFVGNREGLGR